MATSCNFSTRTKVKSSLDGALQGKQNTYSIYSNSIGHNKYTIGFTQYYTEHYGELPYIEINGKLVPDLNTDNSEQVAKAMIEYYRQTHSPKVSDFAGVSEIDDIVSRNGYTSIDAREKGKEHIANYFLKVFKQYFDAGIEIEGNAIAFYTERVKERLIDDILQFYSDIEDIPLDEARAEYEELLSRANDENNTEPVDMDAEITRMLGGEYIDESAIGSNLRALWRELNGSKNAALAYVDEVFCNKKLGFIRNRNKDSFDEINQKLKMSTSLSDDEGGSDVEIDEEYTPDDSFAAFDSHGGQFKSFTMHLSERLTLYFNTLIKSEVGDDLFGIPECMDATEVATMLYKISKRFTTPAETINAIREVSELVKGYECFQKLADDLENDLDFATEFRTVFIKTIMSKLQIQVNGRRTQSHESNLRSDDKTTLVYNFRNDISSTATGIDETAFNAERYKLDRQIAGAISTQTTDRRELVALTKSVVKLYKQIFPSIEEASIISYIELNNGAVGNPAIQLDNMQQLLTTLTGFSKDITTIKNNARENNRLREEAKNRAKELKREKEKGNTSITSKQIQEAYKVVTQDILSSGATKDIIGLVDKLLSYSAPRIQLNSPNVLGNSSSDVLNNNYITSIKKLFDQSKKDENDNIINPALIRWGEARLKQTKQFKYNPIFVEQYDKDGNAINKAIFRIDAGGSLHITEHAEDILSTYLFDGATYFDEGNNVMYNKMGEGGYLPSCVMAYFNPVIRPNEKGVAEKFAGFFCRTPSDAPKNFIIRTVKHNTAGLYEIAEPNKLITIPELAISRLPALTGDEVSAYKIKAPALNETEVETAEVIINNIIGANGATGRDKIIWINRKDAMVKLNDDENDETYVTRIKLTIDGVSKNYVFKGTLRTNKGGKQYLSNTTFLGVADIGAKDRNSEVHEVIANAIKNKISTAIQRRSISIGEYTYDKLQRRINRNHPIFKLYINQFKQELLDSAKAIEHYFEVDDKGWIEDSDGSRKSTVKIIKVKDGVDNKKGYDFYHLGENGKVLDEEQKDGTTNYSLGGNVFHSNKFTLTTIEQDKEGNDTVVTRNYLDELIATSTEQTKEGRPINLLYGGGNTDSYLHVIKRKNKDTGEYEVDDVYLTDEQNLAVENAMEEWLIAYIDQVGQALHNKRQFLHNINLSEENITDFALNYHLWYIESDALFEGDTKFYKNAQTILKRAKEIQGSGVPYGIADYLDIDSPINDATTFLNSDKGQALLEGTGLEGLKLRKTFTGITIANSTMTNVDGLARLRSYLVDKKLMTAEDADQLLYGPIVRDKEGNIKTDANGNPVRKGGFTEQKINDAQSYITFEEFVRRLAAKGQLKKYLPLIKKLSNPNSRLSAKDLKEFVQVQKNFYYDQWYDERYGIIVPRQIKNAEFVLVPRFIEGTELETLNKLMHDNGIDQVNTVETSKAANEEIITLWDNNGNFVGEEDFNNKAGDLKQEYNYNYLYTQQETQQHIDATNKAGIQIVKKLIDNIPEGHPLYSKKQEFFKLFVANIESSYNKLLDKFGVKRDNNGNIIINPDGSIDINKEEFYKEFKNELLRLGVNSNIIDYITLENGVPKAPLILNNVIRKLESVSQSLFNNNITRQRLKGFHAAQVTNIGWHSLGTKDTITYDKDLEYHPEQYININDNKDIISNREYKELLKENPEKAKEYTKLDTPAGYIEVMVSAATLGIDKNSAHYLGMSDKEILEELKAKKLDMFVGYRIPTEGKQSVAVMKVVGIIDDASGSTIVVPNDWVSQTGSDFDIDSIYGIQEEFYKDGRGEVHKIEYKTNGTLLSYINWVDRQTRSKSDINTSEEVDEIKGSIREELDKKYKELQKEESKLFHALPKPMQTGIKKRHEEFEENAAWSKKERYEKQLEDVLKYIKQFKSKKKFRKVYEENKELIDDYESIVTDVQDFVSVSDHNYTDIKNKRIVEYYNGLQQTAEAKAAEKGLMSYAEWSAAMQNNPEKMNNDKARGTRIARLMIEIMTDPSSLEEQLSRSNFDDITIAKSEVMSDNSKLLRAGRNAYNILNQIAFQEDATSGLALKGISVSMDTFCSICNTVRPRLNRGIKIIYDKRDFADMESVSSRYNVTNDKNNQFEVYHNQYGWSKDNKNIRGKILTAYSSETTAHILDAIKEGAVPGVNQYTFTTYKTLVNVGSDFKTAIAFITQPGVQAINDANEMYNSVFATQYGNPIHQAIRTLAKKLKIQTNITDSASTIVSNIREKYTKELSAMYGSDNVSGFSLDTRSADKLPLSVPLMMDRINETGIFATTSPVEENVNEESTLSPTDINKLLFDISIVLQFNKIKHIADRCGKVQRCCNPDKFGAKQTVFATNEIFKDLKELVEEDLLDPEHSNSVLSVDGIPMLYKIYPGIEEATNENPAAGFVNHSIEDSLYPTLYAYLKYASATSVIINRELFPTQHMNFVNAVSGFSTVLTGTGVRLEESQYNDIQAYLLASDYNKTAVIKQPIDYILNPDGTLSFKVRPTIEENASSATAIVNPNVLVQDMERSRIYGAGFSSSMRITNVESAIGNIVYTYSDFKVQNVWNPTNEEVQQFAKYSPAQKVQWIKMNFADAGVFKYFDVNLLNGPERGRKAGTHTIEFTEDSINDNVMLYLFNQAYNSTHPFVKMAAIDCIKYAIMTEGLIMTRNGISKVIPNAPLLTSIEDGGLGFTDEVSKLINNIGSSSSAYRYDSYLKEMYEDYLRGHDDIKGLRTLYLNKEARLKYKPSTSEFGTVNKEMIVFLPDGAESQEDQIKQVKEWQERMVSAGIYSKSSNERYKVNEYVRIHENDETTLYKIVKLRNRPGVVLYPLNKLLPTEHGSMSVNEEFNVYARKEYYKLIIDEYDSLGGKNKLLAKYNATAYQQISDKATAEDYFNYLKSQYKSQREISRTEVVELNLESKSRTSNKLGYKIAYDNILNNFNNNLETSYYMHSPLVYRDIKGKLGNDTVTLDNGRQITLEFLPADNLNTINTILRNAKRKNISLEEFTKTLSLYKIVSPSLVRIMLDHYNAKLESIKDLVLVREKKNTVEVLESVFEDTLGSNAEFIATDASNGNTDSRITKYRLEQIIKHNGELTDETKEQITREIASAANAKAEELSGTFYAITDSPFEDNVKLSMLDDIVQDILMNRTDPVEGVTKRDIEKDFQKTVNGAIAFLEEFGVWENVDVSNQPISVRQLVDDIKESVTKVKKLPIEDAVHKFNANYVSSLSTNPLVVNKTIDIMDNYWKTYGNMWKFFDVAETANPLLQVALKQIMADVEAKVKHGRRRTRKFLKELSDIEEEARRNGKEVNYDNIIDEDGRRYRPYKAKLIYDINELYSEMERERNIERGSVRHLWAKLKYDEMVAKHFRQEAKQEYYIKKVRDERIMLENYPELYSKYMKLYFRRLDIFQHSTSNRLSDDERNELQTIQVDMKKLYAEYFIDEDGNTLERPDDNSDEGKTAAYYLRKFLESRALEREHYFEYDSVYGFKEQLEINLNIVRTAEDRDGNGIPRRLPSELVRNKEYQEAKKWLMDNAIFTVNPTTTARSNPNSIIHKIEKAFNKLMLSGNAKVHKVNEIASKRDAFDQYHQIDGTKFTDEDIDELKRAQEARFGTRDCPPGSDTILISSADKDDNVYKPSFYGNLRLNGDSNSEYIALVTELNKHLIKIYDPITGIVDFSKIPDTREGINELYIIADLYKRLDKTWRKTGTNTDRVDAFIEENIDQEFSEREKQIFKEQYDAARINIDGTPKSQAYQIAWIMVNYRTRDDGSIITDDQGNQVVNGRIYHGFRPKADKIDQWIDNERKEALETVATYYRKVPTVYWEQAKREARRKADTDPTFNYGDWLARNYVYNPYTKELQLLDCWVTSEPIDELFIGKEYEARWEPRGDKRKSKVKDGTTEIAGRQYYVSANNMRDNDFNPNATMWENYIDDPNSEYRNTKELNEYEKRALDLIDRTLKETASTDYAKFFFDQGFMPIRRKNTKDLASRIATESAKSFGFIINKDEANKEFYDELSYSKDLIPAMPMMEKLRSKELGSERFNLPEPTKSSFPNTPEGDAEYVRQHDEWLTKKREHLQKEREINNQLLDRNWKSVMQEYLDRSDRYNAVLENRDRLYYYLNCLQRQKAFSRQHGMYGDLKEDRRRNVFTNDKIAQTQDNELLQQYTTLMRRLLFNQWKEDEGKVTSAMKGLQIFTSANYMMLNYRGGIANVTVGEMNILAEAAAGEYIDKAAWGFGTGHWIANSLSFIRGMYDETSYSKEDAIIKYFKVVDYDEVTGVNAALDLEKYSKRLRDFMFHPQTIGEHFMQNSVLFAMLNTHKVVKIPNDPRGVGAVIMNLGDYIRYHEAKDLEEILTPEQLDKFNKFKASVMKSKQKIKDYAWWRKDLVTEFMALHCDAAQRKKFIEKRAANRERRKAEFDSKINMWDQIKLGDDGTMDFVDGSELKQLDELYLVGDKVTAAEALCGEMTERVRKVNNKIHGVYNKIGQAWIEGKWYGGLVMQYHKHLPMGLLKHYRARGYYNETRGTVEKGLFQSIVDFLSLNVRVVEADKIRQANAESFDSLSEENIQALEALQFHLSSSLDYLLQLRSTLHLLPEYERANLRRNLGDLIGTLSGIAFTIALLAFGGGADDDDDLLAYLYHLGLYESDRLASEVFLYNPIGLWTETKTLMSTPVAAQSIINDGLNAIVNITKYITGKDEDLLYYKSGRFAGRNRLWVYLERRIPIWNGIRGILDTPSNNRYYKRGKTAVSLVPTKEIAEAIRNGLGID